MEVKADKIIVVSNQNIKDVFQVLVITAIKAIKPSHTNNIHHNLLTHMIQNSVNTNDKIVRPNWINFSHFTNLKNGIITNPIMLIAVTIGKIHKALQDDILIHSGSANKAIKDTAIGQIRASHSFFTFNL